MVTEICVMLIILGIWIFSIIKFLRYWWIWLIPAPGEPYLPLPNHTSDAAVDQQYGSGDDIKLRQPWRFPSLVSLPLYPQKAPSIHLTVPDQRTSRSPSLPSMRGFSPFVQTLSCRSDSEPNISITGYTRTRAPSIVLTRASVERDGERKSLHIESRLPSNLSLGSTEIRMESQYSLRHENETEQSGGGGGGNCYLNPLQFSGQRSITPILFPQHRMNRSTSELISLCDSRRNSLVSELPHSNISRSHLNIHQESQTLRKAPSDREKRLLTGVLASWTGKRPTQV